MSLKASLLMPRILSILLQHYQLQLSKFYFHCKFICYIRVEIQVNCEIGFEHIAMITQQKMPMKVH